MLRVNRCSVGRWIDGDQPNIKNLLRLILVHKIAEVWREENAGRLAGYYSIKYTLDNKSLRDILCAADINISAARDVFTIIAWRKNNGFCPLDKLDE